MSFFKKIRWVLVGKLIQAISLVGTKVCQMTVIGEEEYRRVRRGKKPVIFLMWHGRICILPYFFRRRRVMILISPSDDGELATQILAGWGFQVIRGSSSHPIIRVWKQMKEELRQGGELILVADGPRGPNRKLKPGCIRMAQETGAYLVPFTFSASRKKIFQSWDRFLFYFPFSKIVAIYGTPFSINSALGADEFEKERQRIESFMCQLDRKADEYFK